ncbi:hypothetical protein GCM10010483_15500 [Actinokineospora diospyrosa]
MAPDLPSGQALGMWAGADLTGGELAPPGPSVQGLARWAGADLAKLGWHRRFRVSSGRSRTGWHLWLRGLAGVVVNGREAQMVLREEP